MAQAYELCQEPDQKARLFSHQLLLLWSFAEAPALRQALHTYHEQHVETVRPMHTDQALSLSAAHPPTIGFLSPDIRLCSAVSVIADVLQYAPRTRTVVYSAGGVTEGDIYQKLKGYTLNHRRGQWRDIGHLSDLQKAQRIQQDSVDILIDLAGHTSLSQLRVLAHQPAPLQFSGLTFNGGVGLGKRCFRFTDPLCTPSPDFYPHDLPVYLPTWIATTPEAYDLKSRHQAHLDYLKHNPKGHWNLGCAHHPGRLSDPTLHVWAELLKQLPDTQLHLKHGLYSGDFCRERIQRILIDGGAKARQIHFSGHSDYGDYLDFYTQLDLALDPFPYHGGLVSCDALWMGVPLVTHGGWMRGGESLLHQVGISATLRDAQAYIHTALSWLDNLAWRQEVARFLPEHMGQSVAGQPHRWVRHIFDAVEQHIKIT